MLMKLVLIVQKKREHEEYDKTPHVLITKFAHCNPGIWKFFPSNDNSYHHRVSGVLN